MENAELPVSTADVSPQGGSELIVLGSGSSTGVPSPICLLCPTDPPCYVCHSAIKAPPESNRNYRCNPSLLINYMHDDGQRRYIQIDAGKNFKEQVLRWFVPSKIPRLDALILTHEHADAILGLDEIRGVQPYNSDNRIPPMPVFLSQHTMDSVTNKFPYLVEKELRKGQEIRRVAQLDWHVIESSCNAPFEAAGLTFVPLPVWHGEDYLSLGFLFGRKFRVAYVSDVSRFPADTEYEISSEGAGQVDVLILDSLNKGGFLRLDLAITCLAKCNDKQKTNSGVGYGCTSFQTGPHNTHLCLPQSLEVVKRLKPRRAFFVGMTHEFEHDSDNAALAAWSQREGIQVQLAYDGLRIPLDL